MSNFVGHLSNPVTAVHWAAYLQAVDLKFDRIVGKSVGEVNGSAIIRADFVPLQNGHNTVFAEPVATRGLQKQHYRYHDHFY
jgi:hypothetical protein